MSNPQVAPVESSPKGRPLQLGEAVLQGRIQRVQKHGDTFVHLIVLPAPDAYTPPATVEVVAKQRLGQAEDDVRVRVRIAGYRRSYKSTDRETGEVRQVQTADNKLFVVED